jgi:hypothetical protein
MYFARRPLISLLLIGIFLASCGGQPAAGEPTPDVDATIAAGAQTLVASVFQTQTAAAPTMTNTSIPTVTAAPTTSPWRSLGYLHRVSFCHGTHRHLYTHSKSGYIELRLQNYG